MEGRVGLRVIGVGVEKLRAVGEKWDVLGDIVGDVLCILVWQSSSNGLSGGVARVEMRCWEEFGWVLAYRQDTWQG
jgi:hypothetical protein